MAFDNLLIRLLAQIAKSKAKRDILSQYGPPSRDDILHDGLVGAGETLGGILGTTAGIMGGEAAAGPPGAALGGVALGPPGALAGGWAAHGAYLGGQLIRDALSPPEDAMQFRPAMGSDDELTPFMRSLQSGQGEAGPPREQPIRFLGRRDGNALGNGMSGWTGILPDGNMNSTAVSPNASSGNVGGANVSPSSALPFATGAPSIPFLPSAAPGKLGGLPGLLAEVGAIDPSNPDQPLPGGLAGLFAEYMRNSAPGRD